MRLAAHCAYSHRLLYTIEMSISSVMSCHKVSCDYDHRRHWYRLSSLQLFAAFAIVVNDPWLRNRFHYVSALCRSFHHNCFCCPTVRVRPAILASCMIIFVECFNVVDRMLFAIALLCYQLLRIAVIWVVPTSYQSYSICTIESFCIIDHIASIWVILASSITLLPIVFNFNSRITLTLPLISRVSLHH